MADLYTVSLTIDPSGSVRGKEAFVNALREIAGATKETQGGVRDELKKTSTVFETIKENIGEIAAVLAGGFGVHKIIEFARASDEAARRFEALSAVVLQTGKNFGYTSEQVQRANEQIRAASFSLNESKEITNRLMIAQIDLSKSSELAAMAQNVSAAAHTTGAQAMEELIRAISTGADRGLKMMGVVVDLANAERVYAAAHGKTSAELSEREAVQARLNALLGMSSRFEGEWAAKMGTTEGQIEEMTSALDDLKVVLGAAVGATNAELVHALGEAFKDSIEWIKQHPEMILQIRAAIISLVAALITLLAWYAAWQAAIKAVAAWQAIVAGFETLQAVFSLARAVRSVADAYALLSFLNPKAAIGAIAGLTAGFIVYRKLTNDLAADSERLTAKIEGVGKAASETDRIMQQLATRPHGGWGSPGPTSGGAAGSISSMYGMFGQLLGDPVSAPAEPPKITTATESALKAFRELQAEAPKTIAASNAIADAYRTAGTLAGEAAERQAELNEKVREAQRDLPPKEKNRVAGILGDIDAAQRQADLAKQYAATLVQGEREIKDAMDARLMTETALNIQRGKSTDATREIGIAQADLAARMAFENGMIEAFNTLEGTALVLRMAHLGVVYKETMALNGLNNEWADLNQLTQVNAQNAREQVSAEQEHAQALLSVTMQGGAWRDMSRELAHASAELGIEQQAELDRMEAMQTLTGEALDKRLQQIDRTKQLRRETLALTEQYRDQMEAAEPITQAFQAAESAARNFFSDLLENGTSAFAQLGKALKKALLDALSDEAMLAVRRAIRQIVSGDPKDVADGMGGIVINGRKDISTRDAVIASVGAGIGVGGMVGTETRSPWAGALSGAAAGFGAGLMTGNPIAAIAGAVAGFISGLVSAGQASKEYAKAQQTLQMQYEASRRELREFGSESATGLRDTYQQIDDMTKALLIEARRIKGDYDPRTNSNSDFTARNAEIARVEADATAARERVRQQEIRKLNEDITSALNDALGKTFAQQRSELGRWISEQLDRMNETGDFSRKDDLDEIARIQNEKINRAEAFDKRSTGLGLDIREAQAQGRGFDAQRLQQILAFEQELFELRQRSADPEIIKRVQDIQDMEKARLEEQIARQKQDVLDNIEVRRLAATGDTDGAERMALELQHQKEMRELEELMGEGLDEATRAALEFVHASESAALAAQQAARAMAQAMSDMQLQWSVFGTSFAGQLEDLTSLFGFDGLSADEIKGMFTQIHGPDDHLTDEQRALNQQIAAWLDAWRRANPDAAPPPVPTGGGGAGGATTSLASTGIQSVSVDQAGTIIGLLFSMNSHLARIVGMMGGGTNLVPQNTGGLATGGGGGNAGFSGAATVSQGLAQLVDQGGGAIAEQKSLVAGNLRV